MPVWLSDNNRCDNQWTVNGKLVQIDGPGMLMPFT